MKRMQAAAVYLVAMTIFGVGLGSMAIGQTAAPCKSTDAFCLTPQVNAGVPTRLDAVSLPRIATPEWLSAGGGSSATSGAREVTYMVATKGTVSADFEEFKSQV